MIVTRLAHVDPWAAFTWSVMAAWHDLSRMIRVSLAWAIIAMPAVVALWMGEPVLLAMALLPMSIATTWMFGTMAPDVEGARSRQRTWRSTDLGLAVACWAWLLGVASLVGLGAGATMAGYLLGAVGVLVLPTSLAYGPIRGQRGAAALRGGAIIAALRPGAAVTLAGVACLAVMACVATAGALLVVAPAFVALVGCRMVASLFEPG